MKKVVLILSAVAALLSLVLGGIAWFSFNTQEKNKNLDKTSAARRARWSTNNNEVDEQENENEGDEDKVVSLEPTNESAGPNIL